jgi:protein-disulfide isomerase
MDPRPSSPLTIPAAIIIAAAIIAVAVIYVFGPSKKAANTNPSIPAVPQIAMAAVTANDHIFGNPNAPLRIVEYSDPSCPFCKMFNPTMEQVMANYGPSGKVAWVYRSFPLDKPDQNGDTLHPNAGHEAQALECAAFIGGNDSFWKFEKEWYDTFPLQGATQRSTADDTTQLAQVAKTVGLDAQKFSDCLSSGQFKGKVESQYTDGINAGVSGTPYNVILTPSGSKIPLVGAVSYATVKTTIDTILTGDSSSQ